MSVESLLQTIQDYKSENVFNPYKDVCQYYDTVSSPKKRLKVLTEILHTAQKRQIETIWLGRDLGHRGGRRTGLALTDDINVDNHLNRWNISDNPFSDIENPIKEQTATVIWSKLQDINENIFLWNIFPFHPHIENQPLTNRCHNRAENLVGKSILLELIEILKPRKILAIGNDAHNSVEQLNLNITLRKARHPSYGGKNDFLKAIHREYGI